MIIIEVIQPYSVEVLIDFKIQPKTVEEYSFCLGWQDGFEGHIGLTPPVTGSQIDNYARGWALGKWNRVQWINQGLRVIDENE